MADKVPCADSKTVEELLRCISKTYGVPLPTRRDIGNNPMLVDFFNLPVEVARDKLFELYADVNPGKSSRWPEFPIVKLKTLAVFVKKPAKT
jgi:hypothetical protein